MKKNRVILVFLFLLFAGCGDSQALMENAPLDSPQAGQIKTPESFQIFKRGENSPLQKLEVLNGEIVMLEAHGEITEPLSWFSANSRVASFAKAGELHVLGEGRILLGAFNSKASYYFVLETPAVRNSVSPWVVEEPPTNFPPVCIPTTCAAQGKNCGVISDGCGGSLSCGTCSPAITPPPPSCIPTTCAAQGKNCGNISDACGGILSCGTCSNSNDTCGGGGEENICGAPPGPIQPPSVLSDPYVDEIVNFTPGPGAGFGQSQLPGIVLGPPHGNGALMGGFDVLSLGAGGQITLRSATPILNGPGPDLIVFENAFYAGGNPLNPFAERGEVSLSQDGENFTVFPCDASNQAALYPGCAGVHPVFANPDTNTISPSDPNLAGGDAFDLQSVGLSWALYIRIRDLSSGGGGSSAGFDLDAISIIHQ